MRITIARTRYADILRLGLGRYSLGPGWGLHRLDLSLPQGNILGLLTVETESWARAGADRHHPPGA